MTLPHDPQQPDNPPSTDSSSCKRLATACAEFVASRRGRPSLEEAQRLPSRILEAGWEVLRDQGFDAFTFDRVARHARIGKATIYARFSGKREFLEALLRHKVEERRVSVMSIAAGLPLEQRFCKRAALVVEILLSPDGVMMERLVDWCDQEFGDGGINHRQVMFDDALSNIEFELREAASETGVDIPDYPLAARFWLEGLLGHVRLIGTSQAATQAETEDWALSYSRFFFAGLRG